MEKSEGTEVRPTLSDVIHAKQLAAFLRKDPSLESWVTIMLSTKEGVRDLKALLRVVSDSKHRR